MGDPLEDLGFLTRSAHRIQILEKLAERPRERADLQREVEVSRTTVSRTLSEMEQKGWVDSQGWQYELTLLGEMMHEAIAQTIETTTTVQKLSRVIDWLPLEEMGLNSHQFNEATVVIANRTDPTLPVRKFADLKASGESIRALFHAIDPLQASEYRQAVEAITQRFEIVYSEQGYRELQNNPHVMNEVRQIAASGQGEFYVSEREYPLQIVIVEGVVGLLPCRGDGTYPIYIETQNESVISWANQEFESYRRHAKTVTPDICAAK